MFGRERRCPLSQRSVRTALIVFPPPAFDDLLGLVQGHEPVHVQTLGAKGAVERVRLSDRFEGRSARLTSRRKLALNV